MSRRTWKRPADAKPGDKFRAGRRLWSAKEDAILRRRFPHEPTAGLAKDLRRTRIATDQRAHNLGLHKSPEYLASPAACRLRQGDNVGWAHRFPKGHVPANKGLRRPGYGPGRMKETQFKKGRPAHEARNYLPIGSERLSKDGYLERKVTDDPRLVPARRWVGVHRLVWEAAYGRLRRGQTVVFRNGDKTDIRLDNLERITRRQLMLRNTVHNLPKPIARAVQLLGALNRQIRKRARHEEQDRRSA